MKSAQKSDTSKLIPHYLIIILVFFVGILAYHRTLLKGVFLFDDNALILNNAYIKSFSYLKEIFTTHLFKGSGEYSSFYRPMQSLSFMLDYYFWGIRPFGYHLTNALIHILNAIFIYILIYLISKRQSAAIITSLLFCVHTVLSWPVNYVASRADLLSANFILGAIIFFILYIQARLDKHRFFLFLFSLASFIFAILSKEATIVFPFLVVLYLYCFQSRIRDSKQFSPKLVWSFFIILAVYIYLRGTVLNFSKGQLLETTTAPIPLYNRLFTTSKVFMIYLRLLFVPLGLHMEWDIKPAYSFFQDEIFLSMLGLFIIGFFAYFLSRTQRLKFFAVGWFFINLIPYSNIYPLAYFMGEGWLYIPSVGFFALLALYLSDLGKRSRLWSLAVIFIVSSLIIFYGILTVRRSDVWADPVKLYTEILKYSPDNTKARISLGVLLAKSGQYDKAKQRYDELTKLAPKDADVRVGLGNIYANKQQYDQAFEEFKKAIEINPNDYVAHNNLGIIYKMRGDFKKAMEQYQKALELNPSYSLTYNNIGNIHLDSGEYDKAINFYKKAIGIDPNRAEFYINLGKAYQNKEMIVEARQSFEKALNLSPENKDAMESLRALGQ